MSLNWQNLRPLNNSQNKAFETLCCQLAEYEQVPSGSKPNRVGTPDAGVEYYWVLPDGDELGWQAKFFLSPPTTKQWGQLDKSVKTALETHPRLISYTIRLPIDPPEGRIKGQKSFKAKWDEHPKKWQRWAKAKGMTVEFIYWGEHQIWERLSREEHRGRHLFWFNKELFSQEWFENRIEEAIANVGPRYTPELNVELPIAHLFDGLGRSPEFYNRLKSLLAKVRSSFSNARTGKAVGLYRNEFDKIQKNKNQILSIVESTEQSIINPFDFNTLANLADESQETIRKLIQNLREAEEKII